MTMPKVNQCIAPEVSQEPLASYPSAPEKMVCSMDNYQARLYRSPDYDFSKNFQNLYRNSLAMLRMSQTSQDAFAGFGNGSTIYSQNPMELGLMASTAPLSASVACSNQAGADGVQDPPDAAPIPDPSDPDGGANPENPDPEPTPADGIASTNSSFGTSVCANPHDMDLSGIDNNMIMTCGDGTGNGQGILEIINPGAQNSVSSIALPGIFGDDSNKPIRLSSAAVNEGNIFVGFRSANDKTDLESDSTLWASSGIMTVDHSAQSVVGDPIQFPMLDLFVPVAIANIAGVQDAEGNFPLIPGFQISGPVSMAQDGDTLYVLTNNPVINRVAALQGAEKTLDFAPSSVLAYTMGADGSLTPKALNAQPLPGDVSNVYYMDGDFNATAIASIGAGRVAVMVQGVGQENSSKIQVYRTSDFVGDLGDESFTSEISLTDSAGLAFGVNSSSKLPIVEIDGEPHALVGSNDGSGRVAIVNLGANGLAPEQRTTFVGVFKDLGHNVAAIVPDGDRAFVTSDQGKITTLFLADNPELGEDGVLFKEIGPMHDLAETDPNTRVEAALRGNSVVVAQPNKYSQATVTAAE